MTTTIAPAAPTERRKTIILATCCLSLLIVSMDATIVNVALPAIRSDLHASVSQLQWVIDIYTLVLASLLLLSGATADRFGRRRTFQIGLAVFAAGSLLCSLSNSVEMLIAARLFQAIGGSMLNPVAMSIITQVFPGRRERARAVGVWGAVVGISMALGPMLGGVLIDTVGWRSVFWINLPVCAAAITLTAIFVPESRSSVVRTLDPVGQALGIVAMAALVYGLIEGPSMGWSSARTLTIFAVALAAVVAFIVFEGRHHDPFIDLRFFRSVPFSSATVIAVIAFAGYGAFLFIMSLYLQEVRGLSAIGTGLLYLPLAVATLVCSPLSGRAVGRFGIAPSLIVAGLVMSVAGLLLTLLGTGTSLGLLAVMSGVFGIGFGLVNAPITTAAVSGMPVDRAGAASAVASTSRQVGVSIGVALCGSVVGTAMAGHIGTGFADSTHPLWWMVVAIGLVIAALGVVSRSAWAHRSTAAVAELLDEPEFAPAAAGGAGRA
ncbi:MFS transporter [Rhodococcus sp. D2-41]|uniref:MFS transporter n=1 Tax=Speluncibacter jeojiensis TaxID=2710754 RepID=A0A9X4RCE9_9ACTN|nr:MFS transporter [Rhodococcus sp. D2-41]MDG3012038.1 MFS transporter [Rhodococcus sp. D2-41]MDG3013493.1 MFS transporter [Corynebacteriales bacterium D3-21]